MDMNIPSSIALVDFSHMLSVAYNALGPDQAGAAVLQQLGALRSSCGHVVVCLDTKPYRRSAVFEGYKAGRRPDPELAQIWDRVLQRLTDEGYNLARAQKEEADDVMATLAHRYSEEYGCTDVRLVTADKDIAQCLNASVRWFVPQLGKRDEFEIRDEAWLLKFFGGIEWEKEKQQKVGPTPAEIPLTLAIMGDTSDKIPGVKGIGIKGAVALIKTYGTPEGMANGLVAEQNACKMKGKELPAFWRNFAAGMTDIPKWLALTTLSRDVALDLLPLKYLERLPMKELATVEPSDADDSEFYTEAVDMEEIGSSTDPDWEAIAKATAERERAELAKALPVGNTHAAGADDAEFLAASQRSAADRQVAAARAEAHVVEQYPTVSAESAKAIVATQHAPRVGKDPGADKVLADAAAERARKLAEMNTNAPKTPERVAETQARIEAGNAAEHTRPKASTTDQAAPSQPAISSSPAGSQGAASAPPSSSPAAAELVPKTQGPQTEKLAVVPFAAPSWELATQPRSPTEMAQVAARFYNSRFYQSHLSENGTFAIIALGRELGLGAAASVEGFHIITTKGVPRPFPKAKMLKALAENHKDCEWIMITSADDKQATIKTKHRKIPEVLEYTYTIERAIQAGYLTGGNSENWRTKPQEMLEARATSKGVNRWYPGATFGMHSVEEANDE